jgi:putative PIN family toxin of toxin-antitoxin system
MKVVVDTNVVFSGIFFLGPPNKILEGILNNEYQMILSEEIISEYKNVIIRYGTKKKVVDLSAPLEIIDLLISISLIVDANDIITPQCADQDDIKFLQVAMAAKAKYLISGDKHLLNVGKYPGGIVLNASDFLTAILQ